MIAGDSGRSGAKALALRIAAPSRRRRRCRAPLTASVGIAVYPDDGREAAALTAQAEEGMYAARAAGTRVEAGPSRTARRTAACAPAPGPSASSGAGRPRRTSAPMRSTPAPVKLSALDVATVRSQDALFA